MSSLGPMPLSRMARRRSVSLDKMYWPSLMGNCPLAVLRLLSWLLSTPTSAEEEAPRPHSSPSLRQRHPAPIPLSRRQSSQFRIQLPTGLPSSILRPPSMLRSTTQRGLGPLSLRLSTT
ncbi:hypothetical protein BJX66DRAFT_319104 [Aspergillus keveii]|uniref:Uncharacterized protein n=1 Tax=Aspergillus keveii TaxID=714993 RepID=A0ABR4FIQ4_9EURO